MAKMRILRERTGKVYDVVKVRLGREFGRPTKYYELKTPKTGYRFTVDEQWVKKWGKILTGK